MLTKLLTRLFIRDYQDTTNKKVRTRYGYLAGIVGIVTNLSLFGIKLAIGLLVNSIAIIADAFNNLSDVGSSFVTIFGFKLANKPADEEHPFGHGRMEYLSGLLVAVLVLMVGFEFFTTSLDRIFNPTPLQFAWTPFIILLVSIFLKVWLSLFNRSLGNKIKSETLKATSVDALSDVISTSIVVLSYLLSRFTTLPIDGYIGLGVSLIILYAGFNLIKDTINPLLGTAPDPELVRNIQDYLLKYDHIEGVHDLLVHNYGPGRVMASIHVEVPSDIPIVTMHDIVDLAEREISKALDIYLVVHVDPVLTDNEEVIKAKQDLSKVLTHFPEVNSFHDFRVVRDDRRKNLIFDVVVNSKHVYTHDEEHALKKRIIERLKGVDPSYHASITVDRDFIGVQNP